ncbi:MAG: sugar ABC transporter permease [Eubacteriales bacterium]|nr:sugar ABC transporter permease [Eubacteriales bacterium]
MSEATMRKPARHASRLARSQARAAWGLSAPAITIMFLFMILPFFMSLFYSFTNRRLVVSPKNPTAFVGFDNYVKTFTNRTALQAFGNTFEYTIILVPAVLVLATLLAILVNRKAKGVTAFRMIYFSPQVVTMTVVAVIWGTFFSSTADGLFNTILGLFGAAPQRWLQDPALAMPCIAIMSIWQCVGMQMIIVLGGLQFIPEEMYEAGTIDGASTLQQFWYITIPQLKNTLVYVFISNTIYSLKMFTQVYMLTQGGPNNSTTTLVYLMYTEGFTNNRVGYTSALAVVFFLIVLVISLIQNKVTEGD